MKIVTFVVLCLLLVGCNSGESLPPVEEVMLSLEVMPQVQDVYSILLQAQDSDWNLQLLRDNDLGEQEKLKLTRDVMARVYQACNEATIVTVVWYEEISSDTVQHVQVFTSWVRDYQEDPKNFHLFSFNCCE